MYWRKRVCDRSLSDNYFNNYFNDWLPNCLQFHAMKLFLVELLASIISLHFTMLSLQNAMEMIGFNSHSENWKQLCSFVKLQNFSYFYKIKPQLFEDERGYEIGVLQWGTWTARELNSLAWVFLRGLKFLWLLEAQDYSLSCLLSLSASLTL